MKITEDDIISAYETIDEFRIGVFETMRAVNFNIVFLDEHLDRLLKDIHPRTAVYIDRELLEQLIFNSLLVCNIPDARIKLVHVVDFVSDQPRFEFEIKIFHPTFNDECNLTTVKGLYEHGDKSRLEKFIARKKYDYFFEKARNEGYDEVLLIDNEDHVLEGSRTNIFFIDYKDEFKDVKIITPSLECGLLPGIGRSKMIEICKKRGYEVIERVIHENEIRNFKEAFIINSVQGVAVVKSIDDVNFETELSFDLQGGFDYKYFYYED